MKRGIKAIEKMETGTDINLMKAFDTVNNLTKVNYSNNED